MGAGGVGWLMVVVVARAELLLVMRGEVRAARGQQPVQHLPFALPALPPLPPLPACLQMRKVQEKIGELQAAHSAQLEEVMGEYSALLQQVAGYHRGMEAAMQQQQPGAAGPAGPAVRASRVR